MPKLNIVNGVATDVECNYRFKDDVFQIKNTTTDKFHTVWVEGAEGSTVLKHAITGEV
jgi:hypothetical protein